MVVSALLLLSCLGLLSAQAQDCSIPVGGPNMGLKDKDILSQTFLDGSKVSFTCDVGYTSAGGSPVITCTAGSWSPVRLKCELKECGSVGEVDNAQIEYPNGAVFGQKAVITCNRGYTLVGNNEIRCGDQGWLDRLPVCEVVKCDPPADIVDGKFSPNQDSYDYLEAVKYSCKNDYTLKGSETLSCSEDGHFAPNPPTCTRVECTEPKIENGQWKDGSRPPYRHLAAVTLQCNLGYNMKGRSTQTCDINSQWSPGLPECAPVECIDPKIENGDRMQDSQPPYRHLSKVTLQCRSGYVLKGAPTQTCDINGLWSPGLPECKLVECKEPKIENGDQMGRSQPPYRYSSSVTLQCSSGYTLTGPSIQICDINGQWSPGLPECKSQNCSIPVGGPNMGLKDKDILSQTFLDGSKVSFTCDVGYTSAGGSPVITCTAGSWSPVRLKCELKECGSVGEVDNAQIEYPNGAVFGQKAVITCNRGYTLVGNNEIRCGDQGWLDRLPVCEVVKCDPPADIVDGKFSPNQDSYGYLEAVKYSCKNDYTLKGSETLSCSEDGHFAPNPPTCTRVECTEPKIENGQWKDGSRPPYRHLAAVTLQCNLGYNMKGRSTQTCDINSQWSPGLPECAPVECIDPKIENGDRMQDSQPPYRHLSKVTLQCRSGYVLKGAPTQTCDINGLWSPGLPECKLVECKEPKIENGDQMGRSQPPYRYSSSVTLQCSSGYTLTGPSIQICDINGQWSPGLPECKSLPDPNDSGNNIGKTVGIVFGVLVGIAVVFIIVFIWRKKRSRSHKTDKGAPKEGEDVALS